jgi:Helix-turn-helix domain
MHMLGRCAKKASKFRRLTTVGKLHSIERAAEFLGGLSPWTIRRWLTDGKLPRVKVGARTMVRETDLIAMAQPETPAQAAARNARMEARKAEAQ